MKPLYRGMAVAVLQCLIVLCLAGKYASDRDRLPKAWARVAESGAALPMRGRYARLNLELDVPAGTKSGWLNATLSVRDGRLFAQPVEFDSGLQIAPLTDGSWGTAEPVEFFVPANAPDPTRRSPGEELWVEVTVPPQGEPRPIRLGVKKNGVLTPLELR
jgi:hypothetical protein